MLFFLFVRRAPSLSFPDAKMWVSAVQHEGGKERRRFVRIERQYKSKKMNLMLFYKALSAFSRGAEQQNLCPARISNLVSTCFVLFFILFIYFFAWRRWFVPDWSITVLYQVLLSAVMVIKSGYLFSFFFLNFLSCFSFPFWLSEWICIFWQHWGGGKDVKKRT